MKANKMFFCVIICIIRILYPVLQKTMRHFQIQFCTLFASSFYVFDLEAPFSCDRHHCKVVYNNVSGIWNKMPQSRNNTLFVMQFIINWSSPTISFIEQEPLKILQICDTLIFVILQTTHTPKITEFQP